MPRKNDLKFFLILFSIIILSVIVLLTTFLVVRNRQEIRSKAAATATLSLVPGSTTAQSYYYYPNLTFDVNIVIDVGSTPSRGADLSLSFDPNYLEVIDADPVTAGIQTTPGTFITNKWVAANQVDNTTGKILLSINTWNVAGFTGTGTFGTIKFKAKGIVSNSKVSFNPSPDTKITAVGGESILNTAAFGTYNLLQDNVAPVAPALVSLTNNSYTENRTPSFDWSDIIDNESGLANYNFQLDTENTFTDPFTAISNPTVSNFTLTTNLPSDGAYYWRVNAVDKAGKVSSWGPTWSFTLDTLRPTAVTNLAVSNATTNSATLTWTAPNANPGNGTSYQIRYFTSNITEGNWSSATLVSNPPVPAAAGTVQSLTVSNLVPTTIYYFALKTSDQVGLSPLSNVAGTTTTTPKATLNFSLKVEGISSSRTGTKPVLIGASEITTGSTSNFGTINVSTAANGTFYGSATDITPGLYNVFVKAWAHLRKKFSNVNLAPNTNIIDWSTTTLLAGDINNDNRVDSADFDRLAADYVPNLGTYSSADFNLDGRVDSTDFDILAGNYLKSGD